LLLEAKKNCEGHLRGGGGLWRAMVSLVFFIIFGIIYIIYVYFYYILLHYICYYILYLYYYIICYYLHYLSILVLFLLFLISLVLFSHYLPLPAEVLEVLTQKDYTTTCWEASGRFVGVAGLRVPRGDTGGERCAGHSVRVIRCLKKFHPEKILLRKQRLA